MASIQALGAAAQDRKARLAQLKSLKRKQLDTHDEQEINSAPAPETLTTTRGSQSLEVTARYLSGRNYDPETKGAKLGFEAAPSAGKETLERKAAELALEAKRQSEHEEKLDKPLDLFTLQPRKPNWDLKRDLDRKLDILSVRTDNALARLVRERIQNQQEVARTKQSATNGGSIGDGDIEAVGIEGTTLVEATNVREREDEHEVQREREEEEALLDGR